MVSSARCALSMCLVGMTGCASTGRLEIGGYKTSDGDPALRVGVSMGLGIGGAPSHHGGAALPAGTTFTRSLTQSIGYRRARDSSLTTTTRYLQRAGPLFVSGAIDVDRDGVELVPTLLVPLHHTVTYGTYQQSIVGSVVYALGLQVRVGRRDGALATGVDLVLGFDGYSSRTPSVF